MISDLILQDRGYQQYHLAPNYYQLLPKSSCQREAIHFWVFLQVKHHSQSSLLCHFMYPTIEIQINQKLFKKRSKMVNEGPYATFHWPMTDHRLTKEWPSTLCHVISILMAWILFFGQIWLLFDTGPHYLSFFLQLYQISIHKIILFFRYLDVVRINKLQMSLWERCKSKF